MVFLSIDQEGRNPRRISDNFPAMQGMVAAQPLVLPLGGDLATLWITIFAVQMSLFSSGLPFFP